MSANEGTLISTAFYRFYCLAVFDVKRNSYPIIGKWGLYWNGSTLLSSKTTKIHVNRISTDFKPPKIICHECTIFHNPSYIAEGKRICSWDLGTKCSVIYVSRTTGNFSAKTSWEICCIARISIKFTRLTANPISERRSCIFRGASRNIFPCVLH
jgi:hypothetical protein